jgi:hypothetical protein
MHVHRLNGVRMLRFYIAWVMVAVGIAAFDVAVIRAILDSLSPRGEDLLVGVLPIVNVLAVGLLIGKQRPASRSFVLGFELFGAVALASYVALALLLPGPGGPLFSYVSLLLNPIVAIIGRDRPFVFVPIACSALVAILGLPQLAFALIGGFLSRSYKVTVTRR